MNKKFIYEYWGKTELGRRMIDSDYVSESDLLFLIPNNVKKMHGIPLTRISGKKKRKQKERRKRFILSFELLDIVADLVEDTLCSTWLDNAFFDKFVEFKNLSIGNEHKFW
jgi:hypothetical protein